MLTFSKKYKVHAFLMSPLWTEIKHRRTVTHAPVVVSHTVSMEKFWARFNHLTEVLVLLIHFTMVT